MQHSHASSDVVRTLVPAVVVLVALGLAMPPLVAAETVVKVAPFKSLTLRNGGHVTLRYASTQRVTLLEGTTKCTGVVAVDGDRLVIDRHGNDCPMGYKPEVEVFTPGVVDIKVEDGGLIQTRGNFPRQDELAVAVDDGGVIDLRSMTVDVMSAAVKDGGRILARPQGTLAASVTRGGGIMYWGNPRVTSSVTQGGVVERGDAADANKPLQDLGLAAPAVPPLPPLPSVRTRRTRT